jgi:hypothetical protein
MLLQERALAPQKTAAIYCYYAGPFEQASLALHIVDVTSMQGELQSSTILCVLSALI